MAVTRSARRVNVLFAGMALLGLLAGCTPGTPRDYGVRLNADGTIDFVDCNGVLGDFVVRFTGTEGVYDDDAPTQWEVDRSASSRIYQVIEYGTAPEASNTTKLELPPVDWLWVSFGSESWRTGYMEPRSELVEGEWVWRTDEFWSFVPDHACAEVDG